MAAAQLLLQYLTELLVLNKKEEVIKQWNSVLTCTRALTTSIGLVTVEAVAAARGPAMACRIRWGQSVGAILDSCSVQYETY